MYHLHSSSVWSFCFSFSIFLSSLRSVLSLFSVPVVSSFFSSPMSRTSEYSSQFVIPDAEIERIKVSIVHFIVLSYMLVRTGQGLLGQTVGLLLYTRHFRVVQVTCELNRPILAQIVISMSLTILESSTMTVFTVPSNMRIFRGLCFFLYSKVSYVRKERLINLFQSSKINSVNQHQYQIITCVSSFPTQILHQPHFIIPLGTQVFRIQNNVLKVKVFPTFSGVLVSLTPFLNIQQSRAFPASSQMPFFGSSSDRNSPQSLALKTEICVSLCSFVMYLQV